MRYIEEFEKNESRLGLIKNDEDRLRKNLGFQRYAFNLLVSERLGPFRSILPDTRHRLCSFRSPKTLESIRETKIVHNVSVIICFFNEEFFTLLRTINSVLNRSSENLLHEILLIDDHSDDDISGRVLKYAESIENFDAKKSFLSKVHFHRLPERSGLMRARNFGAKIAKGRILFYLDSHCEVNVDWLPPIIERIVNDPKTIACPLIDLIDPDTFFYRSSPMVRGGFNWALHFKWDSIPNDDLVTPMDFIKPIKSPAMAGGLFAIDRNIFSILDHLILIWMCGGRLEIVPCSRVGHIFRKRRPYDSPDGSDTLAYNSLRTAYVWLDDYKRFFLSTRSDLTTMDYGSIEDRLKLREHLNCSNFDWYLRNIYPDLLEPKKRFNSNRLFRKLPKSKRKYLIQIHKTNLCLEAESEISYKNSKLYLSRCSKRYRKQIWKETELDEIRMGTKGCLDSAHGKKFLRLNKCDEMGETQKWSHLTMIKTNLYNVGLGLCLTVKCQCRLIDLNETISKIDSNSLDSDRFSLSSYYKIQMSLCDSNQDSDRTFNNSLGYNLFQFWNLIPI
ncbi:Polypeptide N-acetylgalactosaminyltransferase 11 [Sarcoptes scabiei]|uniref:Polypeptide N-acetylgalactosaminyltransferase n=1 Tax=Sarcoptes scabiei TaxID=52283 RepID=A0A834VGF4_SARSC|nr:Polypeptide N-acetylgalactosaminyltransferase 11 [Sarcoptes scabiei]